MILQFRNRNLPKRALVISSKTLVDTENLAKVMRLSKEPLQINLLRNAIAEKTKDFGIEVSYNNIWVDIPRGPSFREGTEWPVKNFDGKSHIRLRDVFPADDWSKAFMEHRWKGHIFTRNEYRNVVHQAAKAVFAASGILFNDLSRILCKMGEDAME